MVELGEGGCPIDRISRIEAARLTLQQRFEYGPIWPDVDREPSNKRIREGELHQIDVV